MKYNLLIFIILLPLSSVLKSQVKYFPERGEWEEKSPEEAGFNSALLDSAVVFAINNEYSGSVDLRQAILKGFEREPFHEIYGPTRDRGNPAGVIIHQGRIVKQWGDVNRVDMTFSVTKSYLSTVAGLVYDKGLFDIDDKMGNYIWDGTFEGVHNSKITWRHLLEQSSDWSGELFGGKDWGDRPPREGGIDDWKFRTLNEPGTVYEYNDVRVNLLAYSLLHVIRRPLPQVLKEEIMDPIGASTTWRWYGYKNSWVNVDGVEMQSVSGGGHSGGGLFISTLDHARFGLLIENEGEWNGGQIISKKWLKMAEIPSVPNPSYGFLWWLNNSEGDRHMKNIDPEVFYAAGFGGNYIVIDRENDIVIVLRWLEPNQLEAFLNKFYAAKE